MGIRNGKLLSQAQAIFNMQLLTNLSSSNSKFLLEDRSAVGSGRKKPKVFIVFCYGLEDAL